MKKTTIIIGNIAAGKSTATQILAKALQADKLNADDLFQTSDPFAKSFLKDMPRWALTNEIWLTIERVKLIRDHLRQSREGVTIVDSGLLMSWVYTYSHFANKIITKDEWKMYQDLYKEVAKTVLTDVSVIYLDYSLPTLMNRLKKRGRDYELEFYTEEYLEQINSGLTALKKQLKAESIPILEVKEAQIEDFENNTQEQNNFIENIRSFIQSA